MAFLVLEDIQLVRGPFWATMGDNKAYVRSGRISEAKETGVFEKILMMMA